METASRYIRKKYRIGLWGLGFIKLGEINILKKGVVDDHTETEIVTIKTSIDSQFEHYKQLTSVIAILALIFTMIFTSINTQINFNMKPIDWVYNANKELNNEFNKDLAIDDKKANLKEQTNQLTTEYFKVMKGASRALYTNIYFIALVLILLIYIYFGRFRWIVLVKNVIEEALKEKKRENDEAEKSREEMELKINRRNDLRKQKLLK